MPFPAPCLCLLPLEACGCRRGSQLSGDDGEGQHRAAGLQLQGCEEAVSRCFVQALVLQHLPQALPRFVVGALSLHSVPQHLLGQALVAQLTEYQTLERKHRTRLTRPPGQGELSNQGEQQEPGLAGPQTNGRALYSCKTHLSLPKPCFNL